MWGLRRRTAQWLQAYLFVGVLLSIVMVLMLPAPAGAARDDDGVDDRDRYDGQWSSGFPADSMDESGRCKCPRCPAVFRSRRAWRRHVQRRCRDGRKRRRRGRDGASETASSSDTDDDDDDDAPPPAAPASPPAPDSPHGAVASLDTDGHGREEQEPSQLVGYPDLLAAELERRRAPPDGGAASGADEDGVNMYSHIEGGGDGDAGEVVDGPAPAGGGGLDVVGLLGRLLAHDDGAIGGAGVAWDEDAVAEMLLEEEAQELVDSVTGGGADMEDDAALPAGGAVPDRQTAADLIAHRMSPIYPDARITVLQAAYLMLKLKREGRVRDNVFDMLARVMHDVLLPAGNRFPKSLYLMRRVIGCRTVDEVSIHVCVADCQAFGPVSDIAAMDRAERRRAADAVCGEAGCTEKKYVVRAGRLQPRKTFHYFGLTTVINRLFAMPDFVRLRGTQRESNAYYQSLEARRLHDAAGADINDPNTSVYDIGLDWGQVYDKSVHAMGIIALRCADLPPTHRSQRRFCLPIAIIPGPAEPKRLWTYLKYVAEDFAVGEVQVQPVGGAPFAHRILLSGCQGDTPAVKKVNNSLGVAAYLACHFCLCRGVKEAPRGGMHFPVSAITYGEFEEGERDAIRAGGQAASTALPCVVGDARAKLGHEQQLARAARVDADSRRWNDLGTHGTSPLVATLPYLQYNNAFPLPVAHAFLQGLVRQLVQLTVGGMTNPQKATVRRRAGDLQEPSDVGRRYKCLVHYAGSYTMEDLVNLLEYGCIRMLDGVVPPAVAALWSDLRRGALYFLREDHVDGVARTVDNACAALRSFGLGLESRFGVDACKYNLHVLLCRLGDQERACGSVRQMTEFWIELVVQMAKSSVRYRSTKHPEKVLAMDACVDEALQLAGVRFPDAGLRGFRDWVPSRGHLRFMGLGIPGGVPEDTDDGERELGRLLDFPEDGNMLLGVGKPLSQSAPPQQAAALQALRNLIRYTSPASWSVDMAEEALAGAYVFQYADLATYEHLYSRAYTRVWARVSHFMGCQYVEEGDDEDRPTRYIADVAFFCRAVHPGSSGDREEARADKERARAGIDDDALPVRVLRFAVADLYLLEQRPRSVGRAWVTRYPAPPAVASYGVRVTPQEVTGKMVLSRCDEAGRVQFLEYGTASGSGRFGEGGIAGMEEERRDEEE